MSKANEVDASRDEEEAARKRGCGKGWPANYDDDDDDDGDDDDDDDDDGD